MEKNTKSNKTTIIIMAAVVLLVLALAGTGLYYVDGRGSAPASSQVSNVFLDVDGDGNIDLLVSGEVIFNVPFGEATLPKP